MKKKHVAVRMGGVSVEHEVSLISGALASGNIDRALIDRTLCEVTQVVVRPEGVGISRASIYWTCTTPCRA